MTFTIVTEKMELRISTAERKTSFGLKTKSISSGFFVTTSYGSVTMASVASAIEVPLGVTSINPLEAFTRNIRFDSSCDPKSKATPPFEHDSLMVRVLRELVGAVLEPVILVLLLLLLAEPVGLVAERAADILPETCRRDSVAVPVRLGRDSDDEDSGVNDSDPVSLACERVVFFEALLLCDGLAADAVLLAVHVALADR